MKSEYERGKEFEGGKILFEKSCLKELKEDDPKTTDLDKVKYSDMQKNPSLTRLTTKLNSNNEIEISKDDIALLDFDEVMKYLPSVIRKPLKGQMAAEFTRLYLHQELDPESVEESWIEGMALGTHHYYDETIQRRYFTNNPRTAKAFHLTVKFLGRKLREDFPDPLWTLNDVKGRTPAGQIDELRIKAKENLGKGKGLEQIFEEDDIRT